MLNDVIRVSGKDILLFFYFFNTGRIQYQVRTHDSKDLNLIIKIYQSQKYE